MSRSADEEVVELDFGALLLLVATVVTATISTAGYVDGPFMPALFVKVALTAIVATAGGRYWW